MVSSPQPSSDSVPPSRPGSVSKGKTKSRRSKEPKRKRDADRQPSPIASPPAPEAGPSTLSGDKLHDSPNTTFGEQDFIAFSFSDEERGDDREVEEAEDAEEEVRDRDKGKGRARDYGDSGRKRKRDEVDDRDGGKKRTVDAASLKRAPWAADVPWDKCNNVAEMLHEEVEAFVKYISPTPEEDEIRSLVVESISRAVTKTFPDAKVLPFGSYETKLYLPLGDIDLVIESQSMAYSNKVNVLQALATTVKRAGITDKVTIIAKAKVPIIKFITRHGRFSVDISINQMNGVKAGTMVKRFLDHIPALRALVLITKSFLSQRSMNEVFTGGLGSYSIVCLAISFLQMHPKIRRGEIDPSRNLGVLVMEFFELYGCYFNYREVGISVRDGGSYFNKAQRGWADYRSPLLLSIEDPGDPSNDISRGSFGIVKVRTTLAGAHSIMTAAAYVHASYINARREGRYVQLSSYKNPEDMSILAHVMGVTQETINHRLLVQELHDSKVLHRMLGIDPTTEVRLNPAEPPAANMTHTRAAKQSVQSAWEHADAEDGATHKQDAEPEVEESRYSIDRRQPPQKRRRVGSEIDMHTVYTTDDDESESDDESHARGRESDGVMVHTVESDSNTGKEEDEYDISVSSVKSEKAERTRSYWLSKGVVM